MRHLFPLSFLFPIPVFSLTMARTVPYYEYLYNSTTIIECVSILNVQFLALFLL